VLVVRNHLAAVEFQRGNYADAERILAQVLAEQERQGRAEDLHLASTLNNFGLVLLRLEDAERLEEAAQAFERATRLRQRLLPAGHPDLAASHHNLAVARFTQEDYAAAAEAFRAAADCTAIQSGRGSASVALLRLNQARSLMNAGRPSTASQVVTGALADVGDALPTDHPHVVGLMETSGILLLQLLDSRRAVEVYSELERALAASTTADPWTLARVRVGLASARWLQRDLTGASASLALALAVLEQEPEHDPETYDRAQRLKERLP
jgi:tetratricopeptide (TPR) repeat protein